jgi:hypothetical protein
LSIASLTDWKLSLELVYYKSSFNTCLGSHHAGVLL